MILAEASPSLDAESHLASSSSVAAPGVEYPYIPPYDSRVPVQSRQDCASDDFIAATDNL